MNFEFEFEFLKFEFLNFPRRSPGALAGGATSGRGEAPALQVRPARRCLRAGARARTGPGGRAAANRRLRAALERREERAVRLCAQVSCFFLQIRAFIADYLLVV